MDSLFAAGTYVVTAGTPTSTSQPKNLGAIVDSGPGRFTIPLGLQNRIGIVDSVVYVQQLADPAVTPIAAASTLKTSVRKVPSLADANTLGAIEILFASSADAPTDPAGFEVTVWQKSFNGNL